MLTPLAELLQALNCTYQTYNSLHKPLLGGDCTYLTYTFGGYKLLLHKPLVGTNGCHNPLWEANCTYRTSIFICGGLIALDEPLTAFRSLSGTVTALVELEKLLKRGRGFVNAISANHRIVKAGTSLVGLVCVLQRVKKVLQSQ